MSDPVKLHPPGFTPNKKIVLQTLRLMKNRNYNDGIVHKRKEKLGDSESSTICGKTVHFMDADYFFKHVNCPACLKMVMPKKIKNVLDDVEKLKYDNSVLQKKLADALGEIKKLKRSDIVNIMDMIRPPKRVKFMHFRAGNLHYKTECGFEFPVPISDAGEASFLAEDKAVMYMSYIKKQLNLIKKAEIENS